jgi:ribonuclease E
MPKRMLIDASHPEETRVVVLDGQKVEEFDFEAASKRPLKGNIYLAKVTRVEPSLQAAFVEYGGNRQGFLAFSEIHPDYYQIPVADRLALLAEQEAEARRRSDDDVESFDIAPGPKPEASGEFDENEIIEAGGPEDEVAADESATLDLPESGREELPLAPNVGAEDAFEDDASQYGNGDSAHNGDFGQLSHDESEFAESTAETSDSGAVELTDAPQDGSDTGPSGEQTARPLQAQRPAQRWMRKRHYKIQEVIKRRQIILVQVVKEERGNRVRRSRHTSRLPAAIACSCQTRRAAAAFRARSRMRTTASASNLPLRRSNCRKAWA